MPWRGPSIPRFAGGTPSLRTSGHSFADTQRLAGSWSRARGAARWRDGLVNEVSPQQLEVLPVRSMPRRDECRETDCGLPRCELPLQEQHDLLAAYRQFL